MKIKKRNLFIPFLLVGILLILAACGTSNESDFKENGNSEGSGSDASVTIKVAGSSDEENPVSLGLYKFKEIIEDKTDGDVIVDVFVNQQLGSLREQVEMAQTGAVDIVQSD